MTYEEKIVWLSRYRKAEREARRLNEELAEVSAALSHTTQSIRPVPGGGSDGQSLARAIERKAELEQKAEALRQLKKRYYRETFDALHRSGLAPADYTILHKRYLECKTWEKIADETIFALRWVYTRHHRAVERLDL